MGIIDKRNENGRSSKLTKERTDGSSNERKSVRRNEGINGAHTLRMIEYECTHERAAETNAVTYCGATRRIASRRSSEDHHDDVRKMRAISLTLQRRHYTVGTNRFGLSGCRCGLEATFHVIVIIVVARDLSSPFLSFLLILVSRFIRNGGISRINRERERAWENERQREKKSGLGGGRGRVRKREKERTYS